MSKPLGAKGVRAYLSIGFQLPVRSDGVPRHAAGLPAEVPMTPRETAIEFAAGLMYSALATLDGIEALAAAALLSHAIDALEEEDPISVRRVRERRGANDDAPGPGADRDWR